MNKFSKVIAVALAATMVFGSAVTSFASEPVTSVNSEGNGTSEGHVEKKTIDITLPTVASGSTPFAYIMDPERLITETAAAKYANTVWPTSNDTGVYFNQGAISGGDDDGKTQYGNTSIVTTVTNKSSSALDITIKAEAVSADTDIPLVAKDAIATASAASLYLGLAYDDKDASTTDTAVAIAKDTAAEKTVSVAGTPANYKVAYNSTDSKYEYRALTLAEYQALDGNSGKTQADYDATWATMEFNLEGAVTSGKAVTAATTAPKVKVTWSWADPDAAPTSYTVTYKSNYTDGPDDATESVTANGNPTGPETAFTREGYKLAGWAEAADGEAAALSTYTITEATTLYAIWVELKDGYALWGGNEAGVFYVGTTNSTGFSLGGAEVTSVTVNDKEVEFDVVSASSGSWVSVAPTAIAAVGEDNDWASGTTLVFKVSYGAYEYSATYTQP